MPEQPYAALNRIYDAWMGDLVHRRISRFLNRLLPQRIARGAGCLDVCCGTGTLALDLARRGFTVTAIDASNEMLRRAQKKTKEKRYGRSVRFVQRDAVHGPEWPEEGLDLITCTYDSINYFDRRGLMRFLARAATALKPGGLLVLDINSRYKLESVFANSVYAENRANFAYIWRNALSRRKDRIEFLITLFMRTRSATTFIRVHERHVQYLHDHCDVMDMMSEAGFGHTLIRDDYTEKPVRDDSLRITYVSKRNHASI